MFDRLENVKKVCQEDFQNAAHVYTWSQGSNPHDAEIKANKFADELFLFLAGGYYLLYTKKESKKHVIHDFLFVVLIIAVVVHGEVAESANTYGFAVNAPIVFLMLSRFFHWLHFTRVTQALNYFSIIMYFFSNIDVCNLGLKIMVNKEVPVHIRAVFLFLLMFQFFIVIEDVCGLMVEKEEPSVMKNKKSGSRTRSPCCKKVACKC